tara:strand:+ start:60 stop:515 length:456 start_codon:yes stop_codon:yes gene_type:complete
MITETLLAYIGCTKALSMWMHAAHHVSKGPGFSSDHELLYGKIYKAVLDDFDGLIEKSIMLCGSEICACPIEISTIASQVLKKYETPAEKSSDNIALIARDFIGEHIQNLTHLFNILQEADELSLGMDDYLAASASDYEKYYYFLSQRCKE